MGWIIRVELPAEALERVSSSLWDLGTTGVAEIAKPAGDRAERVSVIAGFDEETGARAGAISLSTTHRDVAGLADSIVVEPVDPANWARATGPVELDLGGESITFEVGPAFGHGGHRTTGLALQLVADAVYPGAAVLDFGAGTGVLSLAAARFGANRILAIENDPDSFAVTQRNLASPRDEPGATTVTVEAAECLPPRRVGELGFDVIMANVLLPVHLEWGGALVERMGPGGALIVSGVLLEQENRVLAAYPGLHPWSRLVEGDWMAFTLGKIKPENER